VPEQTACNPSSCLTSKDEEELARLAVDEDLTQKKKGIHILKKGVEMQKKAVRVTVSLLLGPPPLGPVHGGG